MKENPIDRWIFYTVLVLMTIGIIMVYSASAFYANRVRLDNLYYLKKQMLWVLLGLILMIGTYKFPYEKLQGRTWVFILLSLGLLIYLVFQRPERWIHLGFLNVQVSDVTRLSLILFFADSLNRKTEYLKNFGEGVVPHLFYLLLFAGLIVTQPDFSSAAMLILIGMLLLFISPIPVRYFFIMIAVVVPLAVVLVRYSPYMFERYDAFLHPEKDTLRAGYQIIQSLISIGSGGITGVGFAQSNQKLFFLPEAHTDFIFSIISEEWGLIGGIVVLGLYFILMWRGILLSHRAPDAFSRYLAFGLTMNLIIYALVNIMVIAHLLPPTGLPLPFISYGGSSMLISSVSAGLLLNISNKTFSRRQMNQSSFSKRAQQNLETRRLRHIR
ncbi:MAG: stage V sporulation protein E [Calditrichia bacterium]